MKTKLILSSLALAALAAGCSQDEFETINGGTNDNQAGLIELSENFMIGGAGVGDATTRTHWELKDNKLTNVYMPIAANAGEGNNQIAVAGSGTTGATVQPVWAPSIGLCWLGQTPNDQVYTNYEFYHNGWLGKNQENATFAECNDAVLTNGWLYSDLQLNAAPTVGAEIADDADDFAVLTGVEDKKDAKGNTLKLTDMNLNSGVYKTCNKAIFGGDYIAYYPYNPNFKDAGTIPATSVVAFTDLEKNNAASLAIAENTFRYSNVASIDGGQMAKGFGFNNLSGVIRLVLKSATNTAYDEKVSKVLLYSPSSKFLTEVHLSAAKIAAGAKGTALYASTDATSKTIVADMAAGQELTIVAANANATAKEKGTIYLTALPTTVNDLKVLVQDKATEKWAESTVGSVTIAAGEGTEIVAKFADEFKTVFYAVDQTSLTKALTKAAEVGTPQKPATVKVLGDIVLTAPTTVKENVVVEGDKIIVPEDITLTLNDGSRVNSDIVIKGQTCCGGASNGGKLTAYATTINGDLTIEAGEPDMKAGSAEFAAPQTGTSAVNTSTAAATITAQSVVTTSGAITINRAIDVYGNTTINKGASVKVNAAGDMNVKGAKLVNDGTIEVTGKFAMLDAQGTTVAAAGKNMTNNGKFIDNVGSTIGGGTQYMNQNGDYICKVNSEDRLSEAYINKIACSTIQFESGSTTTYVFTATPVQHNGKHVNIVINATGVEFEPANKAITIGNLTINASKDLTINETGDIKDSKGNVIGKSTIAVSGNIVVNGKLTTEEDVVGMTANNLTVNKGTATFGNRTNSMDKTLEVSGTIEVKKDGTFIITNADSGKLPAYITCTKLIEGGSFTGKPEVVL